MDIATGAIGSIVSKLADLLKEEYKLQTGVKKQVESLTRELEDAQDFLREIDAVPPDQLNRQVKRWADQVRDASYDMEDILDTFLVDVKGPNSTTETTKLKWLQKKLRGLFISKTKARHNIAKDIKEVKEKLKEIDERRRRYKLDYLVATCATLPSRIDPRILHYGTKESLLVGIDEHKDAIVKMLSQEDQVSGKKTKIVSLHGFGGVGKTTLAKAVYDQLKQEYECEAFVSVGQKPDLVKVFKDILYGIGFKEIHSTQRGPDLLVQELVEFLKHKRYLIVIDDVWEIESRERITKALKDNDIGSRIIITTRNSKVSTGMVYEVRPLSEDNSKKLFYTRIFGAEDKCPHNQQGKVSKLVEKILKKCGGVPLALITMASLLVSKTMEEWYDVCNTIGFRDEDKEQTGDTELILSLSYYDLPSHLKTCLLYLSVFPEDHLISKHALIWMWIAEGFVDNNVKSGAGLFEIGEGYFNELINRSLIQPIEEEDSTIVVGCHVHDMILDLVRSLSREANFAMVLDSDDGTSTGSNVPRRLALQNRTAEDTPQGNCMDTTRARSLLAFSCRFGPQVQLERFKILRVLYLDFCEYTDFDKHVGDLHHLRCLGIVRPYTKLMLPKEIGELKFLRVLYLDDEVHGLLPSSVGMLTQLVCLHAPHMRLPSGVIKNLTSLQELQISDPVEDDKSEGSFVKDLRNLSELRVLRVCEYRIKNDRMESDLVTSIGNLHKLQHLDMMGCYFYRGLPSCIHQSHLPGLSHLSLSLPSLSDNDLEILGGLPELSYLSLCIDNGRATLTGTADRGYFRKLRSCLLPRSMAQFTVEEGDSSVSFTVWTCGNDAPAFGSKRKQDKCRAAGSVMPNLEALLFAADNGSCENLGLEYLASLQKVTLDRMHGAKQQQEAAVRHAIQVHPNRPTLQLKIFIFTGLRSPGIVHYVTISKDARAENTRTPRTWLTRIFFK